MLIEYEINAIGIIIDIFLIALCCLNTTIDKNRRNGIFICAVLLFIVSTLANIKSYIMNNNIYNTSIILTLIQSICFMITPMLPCLLLVNYTNVKIGYKISFLVPIIVNFILCIATNFTPILFGFTNELLYIRGTLYILPIIIACITLMFSLHHLATKANYLLLSDNIFLIVILSTSALCFLFEKIFDFSYFFYNVSSVCILVYFAAINGFECRKDVLTKTFNRNYLESYLPKIEKKSAVLLMLDLNNLKKLNDSLGHLNGDMMIVKLASTLISCFGDKGRIFRYGGDEFLVVVTNYKYFDEIDDFIKRFNELSKLEGISVAYGYSMYIPNENTIESAIKEADSNMYSFKREMKVC